jgi:hypothetical protein
VKEQIPAHAVMSPSPRSSKVSIKGSPLPASPSIGTAHGRPGGQQQGSDRASASKMKLHLRILPEFDAG